jgi:hypothetical protein
MQKSIITKAEGTTAAETSAHAAKCASMSRRYVVSAAAAPRNYARLGAAVRE